MAAYFITIITATSVRRVSARGCLSVCVCVCEHSVLGATIGHQNSSKQKKFPHNGVLIFTWEMGVLVQEEGSLEANINFSAVLAYTQREFYPTKVALA